MVVTELGMDMLVRPLQPENAELPMDVTVLGIMVFWQPRINILLAVSIIALQLLRESNIVFPLDTVILVKPLQPENAFSPMVVTELGIVTLVIFVPDTKLFGITCTSLPIVTCSMDFGRLPFELQFTAFHTSCLIPLQPENAFSPMDVTELGIVMLVRFNRL